MQIQRNLSLPVMSKAKINLKLSPQIYKFGLFLFCLTIPPIWLDQIQRQYPSPQCLRVVVHWSFRLVYHFFRILMGKTSIFEVLQVSSLVVYFDLAHFFKVSLISRVLTRNGLQQDCLRPPIRFFI